MRRFRRTAILIIVLIFPANIALAQNKTEVQNIPLSDIKKHEAEQLVMRAFRRFGQTLNFKDIYREMFAKDEAERRENEKQQLGIFFADYNFKESDKFLSKRTFIAVQNFYWSFLIYSFEKNSPSAIENELIAMKPGIFPRLNKRQRNIYKQIFEDGKDQIIKTRTDFLNYLAVFEAILSESRYRLKNHVRSGIKKITVSASAIHLDSSKYKNAYDVTARLAGKYALLSFTVVEEEAGEMKILSVYMIDD